MNKKSAGENVIIVGFIPFVGLLASIILTSPRESWVALLLSSFVLISIGKFSQYQEGKWISFGSKGMETPYKYSYLLGWFLLTIALIVTTIIGINA